LPPVAMTAYIVVRERWAQRLKGRAFY